MKIYNVRGKRVVLDRELASAFGVETRVINQKVKRNINLFNEDSMFQLTFDECTELENSGSKSQNSGLISQSVISNSTGRGGVRKLPFAFTEAGVQVLKTLMKSSVEIEFEEEITEVEVLPESWNEGTVVLYQPNDDIKIDVRVENETVWLTQEQMALLFGTKRQAISKHINNIYEVEELEKNQTCSILEQVQIEGGKQKNRYIKIYNLDMIISVGYRVNTLNGIAFRQWATKVIKQYVMRQGACNYRLDLIERKYEQLDCCLHKEVKELREQVEFFVDTKLKQEYHFMDGEFIKASNAYMSIYRNAAESIIIIDNYIEPKTLALLNGIKPGVDVTLFSDNIGNYLTADELRKFSQDYPNLHISFKRTNKKFHDRYIILDYKTKSEKMFHCGPSSKDAGERVASITLVTDVDTFYTKIDSMMGSPNWYAIHF